MFACRCFKRVPELAATAAVTVLGACAGTGGYVTSPSPAPSSGASTPLLAVLEFAGSLPTLPSADQQTLIERYASIPDEDVSAEDTLRLALLYLNAAGRPEVLVRVEALLTEAVARNESGAPELATFARLLIEALDTRVVTVPVPASAPGASASASMDEELASLRRELASERTRRQRLEAQIDALLQLELGDDTQSEQRNDTNE